MSFNISVKSAFLSYLWTTEQRPNSLKKEINKKYVCFRQTLFQKNPSKYCDKLQKCFLNNISKPKPCVTINHDISRVLLLPFMKFKQMLTRDNVINRICNSISLQSKQKWMSLRLIFDLESFKSNLNINYLFIWFNTIINKTRSR